MGGFKAPALNRECLSGGFQGSSLEYLEWEVFG